MTQPLPLLTIESLIIVTFLLVRIAVVRWLRSGTGRCQGCQQSLDGALCRGATAVQPTNRRISVR